MKTTHVVAISVLVALAVLAVSPTVSAQPDITLTVDGEQVADGETVEVGPRAEVGVDVESDVALTSARMESEGFFNVAGLEGRTTYTVTQNLTVQSQRELTVEINDVEGGTYTRTVVLTRPSETATDLQRDVRSLRDDIDSMREDVEDLRERRDALQQRNENLTRTLNETRADVDDNSSEDDGEGMPGFTALVALFAVSVAVFARRR
ncbi:MAG: PGF-CTERM sorting domain-containing protein [Halobacteriales archaeon]|nr:PGF-CTERM sorting domain-containing protein [Halobacteriales archaeon]